jgi:hypothetical protein
MNKILIAALIFFVAFICIMGFRWYFLTNYKLGVEIEFYEEAVKYLKEQNK